MAELRFLEYQKASICYHLFGSGAQLVFCLHGYSNDGTLFKLLEAPLGDRYTFISIDLPFHGRTRWGREKMDITELVEILRLIMQAENKGPSYYLLGFSLGARLCICLFNDAPEAVDKMILLSPDGLHSSLIYKLLVRTLIGHKLMAWILKDPVKSKRVLERLYRYKLINKTVLSYANSFIHSKRQSTLLYARWVSMSKLHPDMGAFQRRLMARKVEVKMVFGKQDQITPIQNAEVIRKYQSQYLHLYKWEAGHLLLKPQYLDKLVGLF